MLFPGSQRLAVLAELGLQPLVRRRNRSHPPTRAYAGQRSKEGLSKKEIIRCLKVTPPARSTRTCARWRADTSSRGRPDPLIGCRIMLAC